MDLTPTFYATLSLFAFFWTMAGLLVGVGASAMVGGWAVEKTLDRLCRTLNISAAFVEYVRNRLEYREWKKTRVKGEKS